MQTKVTVEKARVAADRRLRGILRETGVLHIEIDQMRTLTIQPDGRSDYWDMPINQVSEGGARVFIEEIRVSGA